MPIKLWCADGVSMVQVHEDVVVLDVAADRYECLVDAAAWLFPAPDGSLTVPDEDLAAQLIETGWVSTAAGTPRPACPAAARAIEPASPLPTWSIVRAGLVLAAATAAFHNRDLAGLTVSPPLQTALQPVDDMGLARLVGAAKAAAPLVPFEGECLHRAYALRRLLFHHGYRPLWVFGVRTWPFAAHCWLQIGDLVVGDVLDRVRHYTPIRAL